MSTFKYYNANVLFGTQQLNWRTANIKCLLVTAGYAKLPTDVYVSQIPNAAIVARSANLVGCDIIKGVFTGTVPQFSALAGAVPIVAMVLYQDTGLDTTSPLLFYSSDGVGFPFIPAGVNYFVGYDQANGGWFS